MTAIPVKMAGANALNASYSFNFRRGILKLLATPLAKPARMVWPLELSLLAFLLAVIEP